MTFERCPFEEKPPYSMVRKDLIQNTTLSPNCIMLLIYLLSHEECINSMSLEEIFSITTGYFSTHIINKLLNEAIEAGYIRKYLKDNRYHYEISDLPKFKNADLSTSQEGEKR